MMAARGRFRVAIIADAHFHDPEGDFGLGMIVDGKRLALRCWKDTVAGARAINESAAVLEAALARVVAAGIRHVILAGDYTDDGQVETTRRLAAFLHLWQARDGLRFYAIPGNHDVFGPHGKHVSARIATTPRTCRTVTSDAALAGITAGIGTITDDGNGEALVSPAMRCLGQPAGLLPMAAFGMFRQAEYLHWETPFGTLDQPEARMYHARSADGSVGHRLMDASYLVEPEAGLWLLMIDANVFEPRPGRSDPTRKKAFHDPSDAGWTALLRVKPFLLPWIADVAARARRLGKALVTVSHYPVLDPFLSHSGAEAALTPGSTLARRTPAPEVGQALIAAGLTWHAGGHLHVHAVNRLTSAAGGLTDLSLPSLVAFPPGFAILEAAHHGIRAETISLDDLPPDPMLASFYAAGGRTGPPLPFGPFLVAQFRARVIAHRIPQDWPPAIAKQAGVLSVAKAVGLLGDPADFARRHHIALPMLADYPLAELIADTYLLREGGTLALGYLSDVRLEICRALASDFGDARTGPVPHDTGAFLSRFLWALKMALAACNAV